MQTIDWGGSTWGGFIWPGTGKLILGYPAATPTETIILTAIRPFIDPIKKLQPEDRADGGDLYIYNKGITERALEFNIKLKSIDEKNTLAVWFDTKANGKANQLYCIDPHGNEHTVRIMNDFAFTDEAYNKYTGSLILRKEA